jgi:hypothetical protein
MCVCMHAHTQVESEAVHAEKRMHLCMLEFPFTRIKRMQPPGLGEKLYDTMHSFALLLHEYAELFSIIF